MGDRGMKIGYSFWGFLGDGVTDTPDGGRSHRRTLVDGLTAGGHRIVFLQADRDTAEAGRSAPGAHEWDMALPKIDALFLEWRWPIQGRNDTPCGTPGHTCDLHRQEELVDHYSRRLGLPTLLWDKDQHLAVDDPLRGLSNVHVCEPALHPRSGATSLLFPVSDTALDQADPYALARRPRRWPLVYVGNQYGRDNAFGEFFARPARHHRHVVAGKWPDIDRWPHVNFIGRVPFRTGISLHQAAHATVMLAPDRYASSGQYTQRIFEAVLAGCAPITPVHYRSASLVVPDDLHACDGDQVSDITCALPGMSDADRARLLEQCIRRLDLFRLSRQLRVIDRMFGTSERGENGNPTHHTSSNR